MTHEDFVTKYVPRAPKRAAANADELRLLGATDGVLLVAAAPFPTTTRENPNGSNAGAARHLWVIRPGMGADGLPAILELALVSPPLTSGMTKHTNLTGGANASCGGELWVDPADDRKVYVNGLSGRYGPDTDQQLMDAESVFADRGYTVLRFGWDPGQNKPARFYRDT